MLAHLGLLEELSGSGSQLRGRCPIHSSPGRKHRSLSVNLEKNAFRCFDRDCGAQGNALDLWAAVQKLSLREAALDLAATFHLTCPGHREEEPVNQA